MSTIRTVIELTHGKRVLVQGIIGQMAACHEWYYDPKRDQIFRNIRLDTGKKSKQSLLRFLLSLYPGDGIRARRIDKEPVLYQSMVCKNYLTNNLATNRKISCKNCQTVCSAAKKNFICQDFIPIHIEDK